MSNDSVTVLIRDSTSHSAAVCQPYVSKALPEASHGLEIVRPPLEAVTSSRGGRQLIGPARKSAQGTLKAIVTRPSRASGAKSSVVLAPAATVTVLDCGNLSVANSRSSE